MSSTDDMDMRMTHPLPQSVREALAQIATVAVGVALTSDTDDLGDIETIAIGATDICSEFSIRYEYFCIDPKTGGSIYTTTTLPYQQLVEELRK